MSTKNLGTLSVKLKADIRSLQDPLGKATRSLRDFVDKAKSMRLEFSAAFAAIAYPLAKSVKMASSAEEQLNKMSLAFGEMKPEIEDWAKTTAREIGRSTFEVKEFASGLQLMLVPMVGTTEKAAEMSTSLTKLAYDLGSVYEMSDQVTLESLRAGLVGSMEPMLKFGVVMTQANLQQFAFSKGIEKSVQKMSEQEKVLLRYAFMLEGTKTAQGDAANTADSFANTMKGVKGTLIDLGASIGTVLLPAATDLAKAMKDLLRWFEDLPEPLKAVITYTGVAAAGFTGLVAAMGWTSSSIVPMIDLFGSLGSAMKNGMAAAGGFGAALKVVGKIAGVVALTVGMVVSAVQMASRLGEALGDPEGYRKRLGFKPEQDVGAIEAFEAIFVDLFQRQDEDEKPEKEKQKAASKAVAEALDKLKAAIKAADRAVEDSTKDGAFSGMDFGDMSTKLAEEVGTEVSRGAFGFDFAAGIPADVEAGIEKVFDDTVEALQPKASFKDSMASAFTDIQDSLGTFSELARAAEEGGKSGGVWGAIIAVVAQLLQKTQFFRGVVEHFNTIVDTAVMALDRMLAPWGELIKVSSDALTVFVQFISSLLELSVGLDFMAQAAGWVAEQLTNAIDWVVKWWNKLVDKLAKMLGKVWGKLEDAARKLTITHRETPFDQAAWDKGWRDYWKRQEGMNDAAKSASGAVKEFAQSLTNVPQGFKVALEQFRAMDAEPGFGMGSLQVAPAAAGAGGTRVVNNEIHIHGVTDPVEIYEEIKKVQEMDNFIQHGTTTNTAGSGVTAQIR